jgi:hypothetical protein
MSVMDTKRNRLRKQITLSPEAMAMLENLAKEHGLSDSAMVETLVRDEWTLRQTHARKPR